MPLLAALLLGGCAAKLVHMVRARSMAAALGPTALFPVHLRKPVALAMCGCEFVLGIGLILTAGSIGRGAPTNAVRLGTALLFLVATCALIELRGYPSGPGLRLLRRVQHGAGQRPHAGQVGPAGRGRADHGRAAAAAAAAARRSGRPAAGDFRRSSWR